MFLRTRFLLVFSLLLWPVLSSAGNGEDRIAAIRALFAEDGRHAIQLVHDPTGLVRKAGNDAYLQLRREPPDLLREAIDRVIKQGTREERIGALSVYSSRVGMEDEPLNPTYHPILLDLLAKDDLTESVYTWAILEPLMRFHPSRETLFGIMEASRRAPTHAARVSLLQAAASLCGFEWLDIQPESTGPRVEKTLADFESWFARNKERIQFTKDGDFRLARGGTASEPMGLSPEDRARIRQDAVCVLRLMNDVFSDEDRDAEVKELLPRCGPALFGAEGADAMAKMAAAAEGGSGPTAEEQAALSSLQGQYPVSDAGILAAIYVAAYEKDAGPLKLARETLTKVSPSEVRRVAKGEPRWVRKQAESLRR